MRILTVLEDNSWAKYHITGSLRDMGYDVYQYSYGEAVGEFYGISKAKERNDKNHDLVLYTRLLIEEGGLDLIFCYVYDDFLSEYGAEQLASLNIPMVNYNVDMFNQWYRQIKTARYFTFQLCAQRVNMQNMEKYGANTLYFPMAARRPKLNVNDNKDEFFPAQDITFLGTPMIFRNRVLSYLVNENWPVAIYGKFWKENKNASPDRNIEKTLLDIYAYALPRLRCEGIGNIFKLVRQRLGNNPESRPSVIPSDLIHGFLTQPELNCLFKNSRINLGFTRMQGDDPNLPGDNQVKLRDFEVPLAGGFYLVEKTLDYGELFILGEEVETWASLGELEDKLDYYLNNEEERQKIALAGQLRAERSHTWNIRFQRLFCELGISDNNTK